MKLIESSETQLPACVLTSEDGDSTRIVIGHCTLLTKRWMEVDDGLPRHVLLPGAFLSPIMKPTRLRGLSKSTLQRVLRNLSAKPATLNWVTFVAPDDALIALHPSSALCSVARESFTCLSTKLAVPNHEENMVHLQNDSNPSRLTKRFQSGGESLTELTLGGKLTAADSEGMDTMLQELEQNCVALRRLDISDFSSKKTDLSIAVLEKARGRLLELIALTKDAPAIKLHCSGLRKLVMNGKSRCSCLEVLPVVGPTLE